MKVKINHMEMSPVSLHSDNSLLMNLEKSMFKSRKRDKAFCKM